MILIYQVKVTIQLKNTDNFLVASKKIGLEVNREKKINIHGYVMKSACRTKPQTKKKVENKSFGIVELFKYFGTTLKNQN
jgi:hypothetical protein